MTWLCVVLFIVLLDLIVVLLLSFACCFKFN